MTPEQVRVEVERTSRQLLSAGYFALGVVVGVLCTIWVMR